MIPSKIVIGGGSIAVSVSSDALYSSLDKVYVTLYKGDEIGTLDQIRPNTTSELSTDLLTPGAFIGRADLATTECDIYSTDPCHLDGDGYYYEFIDGLTYLDSAPATAKYGSRIQLSATRTGRSTTWSAIATKYNGVTWVAFKHASVTIGSASEVTNGKGVATWIEKTTARHTYKASVAETGTVWGSTSRSVRPPEATRHTRPTNASAVGRAVAAREPSVRKVLTITKKNDPNKLLGRSNGYTSAAVLYDRRVSCSDGPGADCGATIEQFASAAKASARKHYIQSILKAAPVLGKEYDSVSGRYLIRVSGDLTRTEANAMSKSVRAVL